MDPEKRSLIQPEQPVQDQTPPPPTPRSRKYLIPLLLLLALKSAIIIGAFSFTQNNQFTKSKDEVRALCPQPVLSEGKSNWSSLYEYEGFGMESAKRLSGAVRIPTQ
jgi:hypothetical protein